MKQHITRSLLVAALVTVMFVTTAPAVHADTAMPYPNWQQLMSALGLDILWGNLLTYIPADWHMPPWQPYVAPK